MTAPDFRDPPAPCDHPSTRADLKRLLILYRPYWRWMAAGIALAFVTLLANVALMAVAGGFIAAMAIAGVAHGMIDYFTPAAVIRACAILRTLGRYGERVVTHEAAFRVLSELRVWFYKRIEPLCPAGLQTMRGSDLLTRIQADIDSLSHLYVRVIVPVGAGALGAIVVIAFVAAFDLAVAAVLLGFLVLAGIVLPYAVYRLGNPPAREAVALRADLREALVDTLQGAGELRVYGADTRHAERIDKISAQLVDAQRSTSRLSGFSQGATALGASLAMWTTLLIAIPQICAAAMQPADLSMLALLVLASFEAVQPLPLAAQLLGESMGAARRIFQLVDATPAVVDPDIPRPLSSHHDLSIRHVRMRYGKGPRVLDDLSIDLPAGRRIALVGESGAGKSSVANVLLRFWDYEAGSIRLGGVELRDCAAQDVRRQIAVVAQDPYLFNATLRANLLVARPDADQAALEAACRGARLHEFIAGLPDGYDTEIGEGGARLSGGQARRLGVARALLVDAPILVLDEPTEGLDTVTERLLLSTLDTLMRGRSVLLITHRLSALTELVDEVLVMREGHIVQRGTARDLRECAGLYRDMVADYEEVETEHAMPV
jgi:ATP-binding cassette, subfamily C, bacterial CydC